MGASSVSGPVEDKWLFVPGGGHREQDVAFRVGTFQDFSSASTGRNSAPLLVTLRVA